MPSTFPPAPASTAQLSRDTQLINIRRTQPYDVTLDGLDLTVDTDVFPPDLGFTSRYLAETLATYKPRAALDMGCGSGYLALVTRRRGTPVVWALDVHAPAVECSKKNAAKNGLDDVRVAQSDLFSAVDEGTKFDLIVFNQPYYPSTHEVIFGLGFDGGREIIERFMTEVPPYLAKDGVLIMPFSDMAGPEHNPQPIVQGYGYDSREVFRTHDGTFTHMIYEFKKKN